MSFISFIIVRNYVNVKYIVRLFVKVFIYYSYYLKYNKRKDGDQKLTVGEKIKLIRTFRGMTQRELGVNIGLDEKGADNRMAQYETNYRVPKKDMLYDIAKALDVNPLNFVSEVLGSAEDIMQTFFWLDEDNRGAINLFSLIRSNKKEKAITKAIAQYDDNDDYWPDEPPVGMWFNYGLVDEFMREWMIRKQELVNKEITEAEYLEWKLNWPDTCDDCGEFEVKKGWRI